MINKDKKSEWVILILLFLLSFINTASLLIFIVVSTLYLFNKGSIGIIKLIFLLTIRTFINPELAIGLDSLQNVKLIIIMISAAFLISLFLKLDRSKRHKLKPILFTISFFSLFNIIFSFYYSSLPVVASTKVISYALVFIGIMIGVAYTSDRYNWIQWMVSWLKILVFTSLFTIPFPLGYLVNGWSFQGVLNHPNMFGIVLVLFIALILSNYNTKEKIKKSDILLLSMAIYMIVLTNARTSLISAMILLFLFVIIRNRINMTYLKVSAISISIACIALFYQPIFVFFQRFIAKGQDYSNILYSREAQFSNLLNDFNNSPIFGNGFGVPVLPYTSYQFSMDFIVEPGNLFFAVLAYSGVLGFIIFMVYLIQITISNKSNALEKPYLLIAPIFISMGEMVFFSSNSVGVVCYIMIALHIFYNDRFSTNGESPVNT